MLHNNKYHFMNSLAFLHVRVELEWIIGEFFFLLYCKILVQSSIFLEFRNEIIFKLSSFLDRFFIYIINRFDSKNIFCFYCRVV